MKLIMFDYDGVIVDSFQLLKQIYLKMGRVLHIEMKEDDEYFKELLELDWKETYKKLEIKSKHQFNISEYIYHLESDKNKDQIKLYDDIYEVLEELSKKYKLAIVSNNYKKSIIHSLNKYNLMQFFTEVFSCDDGELKPHPDLLLKCMDKFKVKPHETVFVGDMDGDIIAGKRAGVTTIAVTYGYHLLHRLKDATYIVDSPKEILSTILNI